MSAPEPPEPAATLTALLAEHAAFAGRLKDTADASDDADTAELLIAAADAIRVLVTGTRNREAIIAGLRSQLAARPAPARTRR